LHPQPGSKSGAGFITFEGANVSIGYKMKGRPYRWKPSFLTLSRLRPKVFADYPYCEKHKEIYEIAKLEIRTHDLPDAGLVSTGKVVQAKTVHNGLPV